MAYPEKGAGYRSNGKSVMSLAGATRAEGGSVEERHMAPPNMKPTDPTITADDVKTWGTPDNARAAARARDHAKPLTADDESRIRGEMASPFGHNPGSAKGFGRSIGFKRGGAVKRRAEGGKADNDSLVDSKGFAINDTSRSAFEPPSRFVKASSPAAAEDARAQAAGRTRRTRATPNSYPVGGRAGGGSVDLPKPVAMPTVQKPDTGDRIEGTGSESNKPSFLRGKKPL